MNAKALLVGLLSQRNATISLTAVLLFFGLMLWGQATVASVESQQRQPNDDAIFQESSIPGTIATSTYLPLISVRWSPIPGVPTLNSIPNTDSDNFFTVSWNPVSSASMYVLEEATTASFSITTIVYQGSALAWTVPSPGKTPATYYYRIKASNGLGSSPWSVTQFVTVYPLFIGLDLRWDGMGFIRGTSIYDIGYHVVRTLDILTDPDTIRSNNNDWFAPNPLGWSSSNWYSYYSVTTGEFRSSSVPPNPSWKWTTDWIMPYAAQFTSGQIVQIDRQPFRVTGPHSGYTSFGKPVRYWELTNTDSFLFWEDGGDWKQYVLPGMAKLRYDAGSTRLLIYDDVLRTYYYQGNRTSDTVQYIMNLTVADSFPGLITTPSNLDDKEATLGVNPAKNPGSSGIHR